MKKKYSDPLMFPTVLLDDIIVSPSNNGGQGPDDEVPLNASRKVGPMLNSAPAMETTDPVSIVNPVEEAVTSPETAVEETSGESATTVESSPLEAGSVMDDIVPTGETEAAAEGNTN